MPDPITTSLIFVGSAVASGVIGNRSDARFKDRLEVFRQNLRQYRPQPNHELATAVYRAYLQATLQCCAALLERNHVTVAGWFRLGILPEKMAAAFRSLLADAPVGVFTEAAKQWLQNVSQDHLKRLRDLARGKAELPLAYENEEFAALLDQVELLMQRDEARAREEAIRTALATRVLTDLASQFGDPPAEFSQLLNEKWFEFFCAGFQHSVKHRPEIANAFESGLLATLVARSEWQNRFAGFAGESLLRIEAAQESLFREQREGFERVESLLTSLLPLLSFTDNAAALREIATVVIRDEGQRVIRAVQDEAEKNRDLAQQQYSDLKASIEKLAQQDSDEPEPLIHSLSTRQQIEGRGEECETIIREMILSKERVLVFAAPGGFGKTALLTKVFADLSQDGDRVRQTVTFADGETIETGIARLLHIDCRHEFKLSTFFTNAGRLIGEAQLFQKIYDSEATLLEKLQEIFSRLSRVDRYKTYFVFDNFEPLLDPQGEIASPLIADLFNAIFSGGHNVHALISSREVPNFSPRQLVLELTTVGDRLFAGLPLENCVSFLRKNGAAKGLSGKNDEVETVLKQFALRVHRIPLALVWAIGYLRDTGYDLKQLLEKGELFEDFDQDQTKEAQRYESKGLKRLHYEQLRIQPAESIPILSLLAFFKRPIPKGALAHLLPEVELNRTFTRMARNRLITHKRSSDPHTRYSNDAWALNLYGLHPVICENDFFNALPDRDALYEATARQCWRRAMTAYDLHHFAYAVELFDCAEALYESLTRSSQREELLNHYTLMLINKGSALGSIGKLTESIAELTKVTQILEPFHEPEQSSAYSRNLGVAYSNMGVSLMRLNRMPEAAIALEKSTRMLETLRASNKREDLTRYLATAYLSKGDVLINLARFSEALPEFDKAIAIFEPLMNNKPEVSLADELAAAYTNKGVVLRGLSRLGEAITEIDKAIAIRERLIHLEGHTHLASSLAASYLRKGVTLRASSKFTEAATEYDRAITILERLVYVEHQYHLANDLSSAYLNKAVTLAEMHQFREASAVLDKAILILRPLIGEGRQIHLNHNLARAFFNKALVLDAQEDWESALSLYEQSIEAWAFCFDELKMYWIMPTLLNAYVSRLSTLINLEQWQRVARDVARFVELYKTFVDNDAIEHGWKNAASEKFVEMINLVSALPVDKRDLLYAELGDATETIRALVPDEEKK